MKNLSLFQLVAIGICIALAVLGVIFFSVFGGALGSKGGVGTVVVWGGVDNQEMQNVLAALLQNDKSLDQVQYVHKNADLLESDLVDAIASGKAPDLVLMPSEDVYSFKDKLQLLPYSSISQSVYQNTFIDEAQLFLTGQGELALPYVVDPLVMYWNRDSLAHAGIAQPPKLWSEVLAEAPSLIVVDASGNIQKSAVAMGGWGNVHDARAILTTLLMQAGDQIVIQGKTAALPVLGTNPSRATEIPAESALRFYTDFANPSKTVYSWNRSLPDSQDAFSAGDLALYFGLASEYHTIAARNPNLNFSVAQIPQPQGNAQVLTYGELTGLVIPRGAKNPAGGLYVAEQLVSQAGESAAVSALGVSSVRRDLLTPVPSNASQTVFNQSALIAHTFLDPSPTQTDSIFQTMVESVLSGQNTPADAVAGASQSFYRLFPQSPQTN